MGTVRSREELLGVFVDDFTCGICLEIYDSEKRKPKVLPCAHSICCSCLLGCMQHTNEADLRFRCPFCNQSIHLKTIDVDTFPNNVDKMQLMEKIMGLATAETSKESKTTEHLATGSKSPAHTKRVWPSVLCCVVVLIVAVAIVHLYNPKHLPIAWHPAHMAPGVKVTLGPDWQRYFRDADGGPRDVGTVVEVNGDLVRVEWEKTGISSSYYVMRPGRYDLRLV